MSRLYYQPPPFKSFEEVKQMAIKIWEGYSDPSYVKEKVDRISKLYNIQDNFMYIVAMFDCFNIMRLSRMLSEETRREIARRLVDGGDGELYHFFT